MNIILECLLASLVIWAILLPWTNGDESKRRDKPAVLLSMIARNEEMTLPTYLGYIEKLDYPKDKISILIQTDHNEDKTEEKLKKWIKHARLLYGNITFDSNSTENFFYDSEGPNDWSPLRYRHVAKLRQRAFDEAKRQNSDYLFVVDCDNFLLNPDTLNALIAQKKLIVGPMIRTFDNDTTYSNYWCGMDERGYYKRTPEYLPILHRQKKGCFEVPMIHSTYLIDLQDDVAKQLQYYPPPSSYDGEVDDVLILAHSARVLGTKMHVLNDVEYGRMLTPPTISMTLSDDEKAFIDAKIDWIAYHKPLVSTNFIYNRPPPVDNLGFDEIYMINLARRPDRRKKMLVSLEELGLLANEQDAVDGRKLSKEKIHEMGIVPMKDFKDPYLDRPITMGEVGCFMSHWNIWQEVVDNRLDTVLVLEDDIRFQPNFKEKLRNMLNEANSLLPSVQWDLIYIGRKRMSDSQENWVPGAETLVWAKYSYWTLGYILRLSGAQKLIAGEPLGKMIPVDEYIPIMFNDHTDEELMEKFPVRDLVALSAHPLLVYPTHYVGEQGYFSDTEATNTVYSEERNVAKQLKNSTALEKNRLKQVGLEHAAAHSNSHGEL